MKIVFFWCFSLFIIGQSIAQNLLTSSTFDSGLDGWLIEVPNGWEFSPDGKADAGDGLWNDRPAIQSSSGPGALVYKSNLPNSASIISPTYNLGTVPTAFLKFNQYYRNFESQCRITVININSGDELGFTVNQNVMQHVETSSGASEILDISPIILQDGTDNEIQVRFSFIGQQYFWLIDDVEFYDGYPYPASTPPVYAEYLETMNYPYEIDSADWPYVPRELIVQFNINTPEARRQIIRDSLGAVKVDSCVCDVLELWRLNDDVFVDQNGNPIPNGGTIGILERDKSANASSEVDGADLNYYTAAELESQGQGAPLPLVPNDIVNLGVAPTGSLKIAVIDTGLDYNNESLTGYVYRKEDDINDNFDDDNNCYPDDPLGWNFVDNNNNPYDNHSHGTHVAGIIVETLRNSAPNDCNFQIIPYKTHDANGISTLFDVTCATYLALEDDVSVINDSWGFYGDSSIVLRNAIDKAEEEEVLILSAAGNDSLSLDVLNQYPACYTADNRMTVGSVGNLMSPAHSLFSNYSSDWVDILAPGENILSTVPSFIDPGLMDFKTGTSMSTPMVSAAAAIAYCADPDDYANAKDRLLNCSSLYQTSLGAYADMGRVIKLDVNCFTPTEEQQFLANTYFDIYPNPVLSELNIRSLQQLEHTTVRLFSSEGKQVLHQYFPNWHQDQEQNLNLASLPAGLYFLHIRQGNSLWVSKLAKF